MREETAQMCRRKLHMRCGNIFQTPSTFAKAQEA